MLSSALKADLYTSCKSVNDSHTFLLGDLPDLSCDCCLQFTCCLRIVPIHIVLEIPQQITQIWGFKSDEYAAHSTSHLLLISLSSNCSLSHAIETFDVWGVAPSCWNHCLSRSIPLRRPNVAQNFLSTAT